ncbi:hypothetical protein ABVK25_011995 [Lepraria finkii]|uniref:Heterokaryon incompatibility domain-containing protein n=1 Tax=Lepraria finkii TaxID=1340010 RepID=A0ABR4AJA9_9LECA
MALVPPKPVFRMVDNFAEAIEFHLQFMSIEKSERDSRSKRSFEEDHVRYEALSCDWGNETTTFNISLFFHDTFLHTVMVKPNLYAALRRLRFPDRTSIMWIDAVCINFADPEEKSRQVSIISEIYSRATQIIHSNYSWLGEASVDSPLAMNFLQRIVDLDDSDRLVDDVRSSREWTAFASLMKRPWFGRRWVVQEVAFAQRVTMCCGDNSVDWSDFTVAVSLFEAVESDLNLISKIIMKSDLFTSTLNFLGEIKLLPASRLVATLSNLFRISQKGDILEKLFTLEALVPDLSILRTSCPHDAISLFSL